jgi:hypothetical protein
MCLKSKCIWIHASNFPALNAQVYYHAILYSTTLSSGKYDIKCEGLEICGRVPIFYVGLHHIRRNCTITLSFENAYQIYTVKTRFLPLSISIMPTTYLQLLLYIIIFIYHIILLYGTI